MRFVKEKGTRPSLLLTDAQIVFAPGAKVRVDYGGGTPLVDGDVVDFTRVVRGGGRFEVMYKVMALDIYSVGDVYENVPESMLKCFIRIKRSRQKDSDSTETEEINYSDDTNFDAPPQQELNCDAISLPAKRTREKDNKSHVETQLSKNIK